MNRKTTAIDPLESRALLSASATGSLFDSTVVADRLVVRADLLKFEADLDASSAQLIVDTAVVKANDAGMAATLNPLFKQLRTDVKTMSTALRVDRLNESAATLTDEAAIDKVLVQEIVDRKNPTAESADKAQLLTDRVQLQTDMIAGLDTRIATRQADEATIFNDVNAIAAAVQSDANASPALVAAINKFTTDRTDRLTTILGDLQNLVTARTALATALAAET